MKGNLNLKLTFLFSLIFCFASFSQVNSKFRVVLDAGHGGKDPGTMYHGFREKKIALKVVLKVGKLLEKNPDVEVVYTRKTDVFIELNERANIANNADANIFVSIHCNGAKAQAAYGTETYVMGLSRNASNLEVAKKENSVMYLEDDYEVKYKGYDPKKPESMIGIQIMQEEYLDHSIELASKIQKGFTRVVKRKNRGVKQAGFLVLRNIYMPRMLIELGFLSNKNEGTFLNSNAGQDKMAQSIANAILDYKKEFHRQVVTEEVPVVEEKEPEVIPEPVKVVKEEIKETAANKTIFKIQIAASSKDLKPVAYNFSGLSPISKIKNTRLIKYYYGETESYEKAKELKKKAREAGFTLAFVVPFRNGKKISIKEALK
ncbi:MAG: N-acetylmuramoyl-L-alanine amidase [Flavobacterium sp. MedPE-SWcel]|uniref:N-acetylmuramoyl-L-alanine amidase family protein n=1 Tax=uncultured Flavobacterium sp. TaxID=165435 RepID=UPI00091A06A0|nr:N-acetylmuramoyl-L-alanine amidase [uncultured Flavobacterium sp.]OIQ16587.1 MAG: N-acetylmuramoyl-L-alanine amidase [Flavobacterium sp. MedPE-SWcel]